MKKGIFILMFLVMLSNVYALTHMTPELFQERYNLEVKVLDEAPIIELDEDVVSYYVVIDNELIDFTDFVYSRKSPTVTNF